MDLFINDMSLNQQFPSVADFRLSLAEIFRCRDCAKSFNHVCYIPRIISRRMISKNMNFRQAIENIGDKNLTRLVMNWIDREGPFVEDNLIRNDNEYYTFGDDGLVVTEEILGEVAARHFAERPAGLVSFAPSSFTYSPLAVAWHHSDDEHDMCHLENFWDAGILRDFLKSHEADVRSWTEMLSRAKIYYSNLTFSEDLENYLAGQPFSGTIARRVLMLLDTLNTLQSCYTPTGQRTPEGEQIIENFFGGDENAIITDASPTEKNNAKYRAKMTFRLSNEESIECFWHAKIKHRVFRIHFSDPYRSDKKLYIAYIGPKLTKK
jgi:hypothetical protein